MQAETSKKNRRPRLRPPVHTRNVYFTDEVAEKLAIAVITVNRKVKSGVLKPVKGFRVHRFPKAQIDQIAPNQPSAADANRHE